MSTTNWYLPRALAGGFPGVAQWWRILLAMEEMQETPAGPLDWEKSPREGNDNPLQCSCLENPRDGGAWWAAVYGVAQSQTWLKWLSSSILLLQVVSIMSPVLWILFHKYTLNIFFPHHFHSQCHCHTLSILLFDNSLSPGLLSSYLDLLQFITYPHFHQRTLFWQEAKKCSLFPQIACVVK